MIIDRYTEARLKLAERLNAVLSRHGGTVAYFALVALAIGALCVQI